MKKLIFVLLALVLLASPAFATDVWRGKVMPEKGDANAKLGDSTYPWPTANITTATLGTATVTTVDINGGAIDGTPIGASSASTGAFTTLNASGATTLDGNVDLGNASGDTVSIIGTIDTAVAGNGSYTLTQFLVEVSEKTASYTITTSQNMYMFTNEGAGADIILNLPAAATGLQVMVAHAAASANTIAVNPGDADQILGETNAAGDQISSTAQGDTIHLIAIDEVNWVKIGGFGTWDDEN